jgi:predicted nucleotidyltransferase
VTAELNGETSVTSLSGSIAVAVSAPFQAPSPAPNRTSRSGTGDLPLRRRMLRRSAEGATRVTTDEIKALGLRLAELCQKYGIAELSVFGSVARGDARADSDVDLLYVRVPGNDLGMSYFALQDDLEQLFGRPVDLVPKEGLHRVIRDQVLADAQVLYAA